MLLSNKFKSFKNKLREGNPLVGAAIRFTDPAVAEMMVLAGMDYLLIDNEHMPFNDETLINIVRAANSRGGNCLIRPTANKPDIITRCLDMGAVGILAADIQSYDDAMNIVKAVKYAPIGNRGMCPIARSADYAFGLPVTEYVKASNDSTVIALICESVRGLENLDEILTIDEVDAIFIGTQDLSASMGIPGQVNDPRVQNAMEDAFNKIIAAGKAAGAGLSNDIKRANELIDKGIKCITISSDTQIIWKMAADLSNSIPR